MPSPTAIVRQPGGDLSACELSYQQRDPIDAERLATQHAAYAAALRVAGLNVITLPALPEFPDSVYVEDTAIVLDEVAVLTRPGASSRLGEVGHMAKTLEPLRTCLTMQTPSTLDGGDVCLHDGVLYVGQGGRTNHAGLKELAHLVLDHGYRVLSDPEGSLQPEILDHAAEIDLPGLDKQQVVDLKLDGTQDETLYRLLLKAQCNANTTWSWYGGNCYLDCL